MADVREIASAFVRVRADTSSATSDIKSFGRDAAKALGGIFAGAVIGQKIREAVNAAADLEQAVGATESVFGRSGSTIDKWARGAARSMGLAEAEARNSLSLIGSQLQNFGYDVDASITEGQKLVGLGADLAATYGGTTTDAVNALSAALRGETLPLRRYATNLTAAAVQARAVELGLTDASGAMDANAKAAATLSVIYEQTARAQGQFRREATTASGAAAIAAATTKNASASLGTTLLPIYTRIQQVIELVAKGFEKLPAPVQIGVVALAGVAALSGPIGGLIGLAKQLPTILASIGTSAAAAAPWIAGIAAVAAVAYGALQIFGRHESAASKLARELTGAVTDSAGSLDVQAVAAADAADAMRDYGDAVTGVRDDDLRASIRDSAAMVEILNAMGASIEDVVAASHDETKALELAARARAAAAREGVALSGALLGLPKDVRATTVAWRELVDGLDVFAGAVPQSREQLLALVDAGDTAAAVALKASEHWSHLTGVQRGAVQTLLDTAAASSGAAGGIGDIGDAADDAAGAAGSLDRALDRVRGRFDDAASAASALRDAINDALGVALDSAEIERRWVETGDKMVDAIRAATAKVGSGGPAALGIDTQEGRDAGRAIDERIALIQRAAVAETERTGSIEAGIAKYREMTAELRENAKAAGLSEYAIDDYLTALGLTPREVKTVLEAARSKHTIEEIAALQADIGELTGEQEIEVATLVERGQLDEALAVLQRIKAGTWTARVSADTSQATSAVKNLGALLASVSGKYGATVVASAYAKKFARGGLVDSPTFGLFGEAGREIVLPLTRPGDLSRLLSTPAAAPVRSMVAGAGQPGPTVHVERIVTGSSVDDVQAAFARLDWLAGAR